VVPALEIIAVLQQIMPEVVLVSSKAEDDLTSCIEKAGLFVHKFLYLFKSPKRKPSSPNRFFS
jgi:hypothetical protein